MQIQLKDFNSILTDLDRDVRNFDESFDPAMVYSPLSDFSDIERTLEFDSDRLIKEINEFIDKQKLFSSLREIHKIHPEIGVLSVLNFRKDEYTRRVAMLSTLMTCKKKKGLYSGFPAIGMTANAIAIKPVEFQEKTAAKNYYLLSHDQIASYEFSYTPVDKIKSAVDPELKAAQEQLLLIKQQISNLEHNIYLEISDELEEKLKQYGYL